MSSYYSILEIDENATQDAIKKAYRKLAKQHHPDTESGNADKFKEVSEAYEHLGDELKRKKYDTAKSMSGGMDNSFFEQFRNSKDFSSMFDGAFGSSSKGPDIRVSIQLTIDDVYNGTERLIDTGQSRFNLKIPKGIGNGNKLKLKGRGGKHRMNSSAPNGDIIVTCHVLHSLELIINGSDIWVDVYLPFYDLMIGTEVTITNKFYSIKVNIPQGSFNGKVLRIGGKGMPIYNKEGYGNLMVKLTSSKPDLNEDQIRLLEQIKIIEKNK
jgi:curved DNA-binding protein|tara:strand:- start:5 stop:811 length:807 start_codon:yes stop_codon:yes gene_type:complete